MTGFTNAKRAPTTQPATNTQRQHARALHPKANEQEQTPTTHPPTHNIHNLHTHLQQEAGKAVPLLPHAVLHVDLLPPLLAGEGRVQLRQHAFFGE
jgi:hypothetical protein